MSVIISLIFLTTVWILGIKVVTNDGMALESIAKWADKKLEEGYIIMEPLVLCPYCLPSIHSMVAYIAYWQIFGFDSWRIILAYPFVVCGASIISGSLWSMHNLLEKKHEYLEKAAEYYKKAEQEKYLDLKNRTSEYKKSVKK